jgi:hypothetical protein
MDVPLAAPRRSLERIPQATGKEAPKALCASNAMFSSAGFVSTTVSPFPCDVDPPDASRIEPGCGRGQAFAAMSREVGFISGAACLLERLVV